MRLIYKDNLLIPRGRNAEALYTSWQNGKAEVCLTGGRSKGKTVALWLYLLGWCQRAPGLKVIVGRTDYSLIAMTFLKTLEDRIMKYPLGDSKWRHPKNPFYLIGGMNSPDRLLFANGSEIRFIGLKDPEKIRGMECDIFVLNEGTTEKTGASWRAVGGSAAGGRGGTWTVHGLPFRQLITDTNPSFPFFWLYLLFHPNPEDRSWVPDDKLWLEFTHRDNAALVDAYGELNARGHQTIEDLERSYGDGFEAQRMIWGKWVAAQGLVYNMYKPEVHEEEMHLGDFPDDTLWHLAQDHGGGGERSPFALSLTAQNDGYFRTFKEMGMTNCTIDQVIDRLQGNLFDWGVGMNRLDTMWCDDNVPAFNLALRDAGFPVMEADKTDKKGTIDTVKRLIRSERYKINSRSLDERDPWYEGPQGFKEEVLGYAYLPIEQQRISLKPDLPVETENHWCDALGYKLHGLRDYVPLEYTTGTTVRFGRN